VKARWWAVSARRAAEFSQSRVWKLLVEITNPTTPATMADARFSKFANDPRYRSSNFKKSRTKLDSRFQRLFTDEDFHKQASVDRYGRRITPQSGKRKLEKLYKLDGDEEKSTVHRQSQQDVVGSSEEDDEEEEVAESLATQDPARQGGFSESESEEDSTSGEESEDEAELAEETAGHEQREEIPMGEVSKRIAVVNLDWDNIRAADIMVVASSFVPVGGQIDSVTIYLSEFGRERLEKEELEGPPREIFASSKRNEDEEDSDDDSEEGSDAEDKKIEQQLQQDQVNEGDEFDTAKLRQYQLERLRYYYAVISCSNNAAAKSLYDSMDGREYLSSANFFDLRFIPDDVSFEDDKPRDECTALPYGYKPNEFRTEALTHSKVKLTWDDDDATRKEMQKRAFSRAEMDENDLQAYIGSDSSDAESVSSRKSAAEDRKTKKRDKMRAALGLSAEDSNAAKKKSKDDVVGDMQITFTSGLGGGPTNQGVFENEPQDEESTRDRYVRKERDRKQRRKEKMKATKSGQSLGDEVEEAEAGADQEDKGFDDPFFMDHAAAAAAEKKAKKMEKNQKLAKQAAQDKEAASRKAELELLMADDKADNLKHFDMREIEKAEKEARRKGKKKKKDTKSATDDVQGSGEGFAIETEDPRFKAVFESHEYALDPSNPKFKQTAGMKRLLEEGRRKRKAGDLDAEDPKTGAMSHSNKPLKGKPTDAELGGLVKRLKGSHRR
jgi:hypothetical protein